MQYGKNQQLLSGTQPVALQGNYRYVAVNLTLFHTTNNTAFAGSGFRLDAFSFELTGKAHGHSLHGWKHDLDLLGMLSTLPTNIEQVNGSNFRVIRVKDTSVKEVIQLQILVDLGCVYNGKVCQLFAQIKFNSSVWAVVDPTTSYVSITPIQVVGTGASISSVITETVTVGSSAFNTQPMDDVTTCVFVNRDKRTNLEADRVLDDINVNSELQSYSVQYCDLNAANLTAVNNLNEQLVSYNSATLYGPDMPSDNFQVNISLESTNVTAAKNFLCFMVVTPTESGKRYVQQREAVHESRTQNKAVKFKK